MASNDAFCNKLIEIIGLSDRSIIFGDFNICGQREKKNQIPSCLLSKGFNQLVEEATQIRGRQIDHIYIKDRMMANVDDIERYSVYYSDHDALLLTLKY